MAKPEGLMIMKCLAWGTGEKELSWKQGHRPTTRKATMMANSDVEDDDEEDDGEESDDDKPGLKQSAG